MDMVGGPFIVVPMSLGIEIFGNNLINYETNFNTRADRQAG